MSDTRFKIQATCYDAKGRVLSKGRNQYNKTHPLQAHFAKLAGEPYKIYLHAEIAAILKAGGKKIHTIKVERYTSDGCAANAQPCPICQLAIKAFGIKRIEYTNDYIQR